MNRYFLPVLPPCWNPLDSSPNSTFSTSIIGSEVVKGEKLDNIKITNIIKEKIEKVSRALLGINYTPSIFLYQWVQRRNLTSMEHRSYMSARATSIFLSLLIIINFSPLSHSTYSYNDIAKEKQIQIINIIPHNNSSFTQGLEEINGKLYESSGLYGKSYLAEVSQTDGQIIRSEYLPENYFAEGITEFQDSLIILTWKSEIALIYNLTDFSIIGNFSYSGEGWGICNNGQNLIMSNGTSDLTFRNLDSFEIEKTITVTLNGIEVNKINELECIDDTILANIWLDDKIIGINSTSGIVEFFISTMNISNIHNLEPNQVLNGIAYIQSTDSYWITGKNWSSMYSVQFTPLNENSIIDNSDKESENINFLDFLSFLFLSSSLILLYFISKNIPSKSKISDTNSTLIKKHHQHVDFRNDYQEPEDDYDW